MGTELTSFPEYLYVYEDKEGDDEFFLAHLSVKGCADWNDSRLVAKYAFVKSEEIEITIPDF